MNTAMSKVGTLLIGVVIARVLGPEDFGTYAIALVALTAILSFNELGVSLAIIRWPGDPRTIAPTVTTISVAASVLIAVLAWIAAPAFAVAMGDESAAGVVQLMVVCVPLNGLVATAAALLQRDFLQGRRTIADQVNTWLGAVISVLLALGGLGAMSLAIGRVAASVVFVVLLLWFSPAPLRFGWDRTIVGALLRFGLPLAAASIVVFLVGYADQLVVGAALGAQALGFYVLAANLAGWPVSMFSQPVRAITPAVFARLQSDPTHLDSAFRATFRLLTAAALPVCGFLAGGALPIITFVYGEVWAPAALALQWLAVTAAVRICFELAYDFLSVRHRSMTLMGIQIAWLVLLVPAVVLGSQVAGIAGVAFAQAMVGVVILVGGYGWALASTGVDVRRLASNALLPAISALVVGVAAWVFAQVVEAGVVAILGGGLVTVAVAAGTIALSRGSIRVLSRGSGGS